MSPAQSDCESEGERHGNGGGLLPSLRYHCPLTSPLFPLVDRHCRIPRDRVVACLRTVAYSRPSHCCTGLSRTALKNNVPLFLTEEVFIFQNRKQSFCGEPRGSERSLFQVCCPSPGSASKGSDSGPSLSFSRGIPDSFLESQLDILNDPAVKRLEAVLRVRDKRSFLSCPCLSTCQRWFLCCFSLSLSRKALWLWE